MTSRRRVNDRVRKTVEEDLPGEAEFLRRYDRFKTRIGDIVEMPDRTMDSIFRFLRQEWDIIYAPVAGESGRRITCR
jgi:hypothetical protein